ncbi:hypothetical protein GALMADRAFT_113420 [Galerina marginata CBS 339.88]|uniref:F-box domain-containing protein n=1 Tax=Galerina marginata (strain CBS 339.88) TaxID=685588 RepID=A0A067TW23_GALM3|nr:hypothetical protein GALMADRAFT_113420 [Galerina marginata CBS 339.88]
MKLTDLPSELIEEIFVHCDPIDVSKAAQTGSTLRGIIYFSKDSKLWRELYLMQPFDDPRKCLSHDGRPKSTPILWKDELQRIVRARTIVTAEDGLATVKPGELEEVLETFIMLVCYVPSLTQYGIRTGQLSLNLAWVVAMFEGGFLDRLEERDSSTSAERQLISRLHSYYGLTKRDLKPQSRVDSRAFVYSLRNYSPENEYGPLLPTGEVNWEHVQALHHVVSMHLVDLSGDEDFMFAIFPMSLPFTQIGVPENVVLDEEKDWAGVAGSWTVHFCFCDHRDLLRFNEASTPRLDTSLFEDPDFREEFRSLDVKLCVTQTQKDPQHPTRPIIYFFGEMQEPSTSTMTGNVQMTKDNQVQWHFVSGDQGNTIWSSEGIQIGGLQSSFGVLGSWTTIFHDGDDPVGPFWMHKHNSEGPELP